MLQLLIVTNYSRRIIGSLCVSSIFIRFLSRVSTVTRDIDIAIPSVRPSVCLSVTFGILWKRLKILL